MSLPRPSTFFCAFLTLLNDRLGESIVFPLLPFLLAGFTSDGRVLGLLAGSYAIAQFAFTPLIGALSDRYGRKPVISVCVAGLTQTVVSTSAETRLIVTSLVQKNLCPCGRLTIVSISAVPRQDRYCYGT